MGDKGARANPEAELAADRLVDDLAPLGHITAKRMFGGHGIFADGVMIAIVDSAGVTYLRSTDEDSGRFEKAGSPRHGRMPYWQIPDAALENDASLVEWASKSLSVARAAKR